MSNLRVTMSHTARLDSIKHGVLFHFAWIALAVYGGAFAYLAVRHILYPGFTEAMEGDILQSIQRVSAGMSPYPRPSGEFIALDYLPLYYFVSAPLYYVFGDSFAGPRLISSFSSLAAGGVLAWIAWRESRSLVIAYLAGALFFSGYRIMDAYLTCALPDSLLLLWLVLGFCFMAYGTRRLHELLWLLFYTLAFWTKQQGAIYFGFAVLYAIFFRQNPSEVKSRFRKWAILLGLFLGGPVSYLLLGPFLGDSFFYSTLVVPRRWDHELWYSLRRTTFVLASLVPFSILLALPYFRRSKTARWRDLVAGLLTPVGWFTFTALIAAAITETSSGASNNHYIPFIAALSVAAALGVNKVIQHKTLYAFTLWFAATTCASIAVTLVAIRYHNDHGILLVPPLACAVGFSIYLLIARSPLSDSARNLAAVVLLLAGQFTVSFYYPPGYLPERGFKEGVANFRKELSELDGPVLWISYGNAPAALTGIKLARAPSWVALDDIARQRNASADVDRDLAPFYEQMKTTHNLYILSESRIEEFPEWRSLSGDYVLVRDYDKEFSKVRQIVPHWYAERSYPRFLYRRRTD